ncbi:MAG: hypothetical protein GOV02_02270 [Candidatus Aenigmarchaeota archaeon]|nr:hypothetical protein [Candidatus Aenigmarchaeota archaeon]
MVDKKIDVVEIGEEAVPLFKRIAKAIFYSGENSDVMMNLVDGMKKDLLHGKVRYGNDYKTLRAAARKGDVEGMVDGITKYLDKIDISGENYDVIDRTHYDALNGVLIRMVDLDLVDKKVAANYVKILDGAQRDYSKSKTDSVAADAKSKREQRRAERKAEREAGKGVKTNPNNGFSTKKE